MGRCELTGKGPVVKNLVSHSNIKTKSIAQPNIQKKRLFSQALGSMVTLRIAASAIRDMEHVGGLDKYILGLDETKLSKRATAVKSKIRAQVMGKRSGKNAKAKSSGGLISNLVGKVAEVLKPSADAKTKKAPKAKTGTKKA